MLTDLFGVTSQSQTINAVLCVGKGYNILRDETKPSSVFAMGSTLVDSKFGIKIPAGLHIDSCQQTRIFMEHYEHDEHFVQQRMSQLGVSIDVDYKLVSVKSKGGFSRSSSGDSTVKEVENSFLYEKRLFKLHMPDFGSQELKLSDSFVKEVQKLPESYDASDKVCREKFEDFFGTWGNFVVASAYGGGSVEVKFKSLTSTLDSKAQFQARAELDATFKNLTVGVDVNMSASHDSSHEEERKSMLSTSQLEWSGGNSDCQTMSLQGMKPDMWQRWTTSLSLQPAILTTEMALLPINKFVERVDEKKGDVCNQALKDLLGGKYKMIKEQEKRREEEAEAELKRIEDEKKKSTRAAAVEAPPEKSKCFPGVSKVWVLDKALPIQMKDLSTGDQVLAWNTSTHKLEYSPLIMYNHLNRTKTIEYLQLEVDNGKTLHITDDHFVFTFDDSAWTSKPAAMVTPGEKMLTHDVSTGKTVMATITNIDNIELKGLYSPITLNGTIIVDDVMASCYGNVASFGSLSGHTIAHVGMAPMRAAYQLGMKSLLEIPEGKEMPRFTAWAKENLLPYVTM